MEMRWRGLRSGGGWGIPSLHTEGKTIVTLKSIFTCISRVQCELWWACWQSARASEMSLVLCVGLRKQGRDGAGRACATAPGLDGHHRTRAGFALYLWVSAAPVSESVCAAGRAWCWPAFQKVPHSKIANIERYKQLFRNFHFSMYHTAGKRR